MFERDVNEAASDSMHASTFERLYDSALSFSCCGFYCGFANWFTGFVKNRSVSYSRFMEIRDALWDLRVSLGSYLTCSFERGEGQ